MAYREALDSAADPIKVRNDQRAWLKRIRRGKAGKQELGQAYGERIKALGKYPKYAWKTYRDHDNGLAFDYPGNRQVGPGTRSGQLVLTVPGADPQKIVFELHLIDAAFDSANAQESVFQKKDGIDNHRRPPYAQPPWGWSPNPRARSEARAFRSVPPRAWLELDFRSQHPGSKLIRFQKLR